MLYYKYTINGKEFIFSVEYDTNVYNVRKEEEYPIYAYNEHYDCSLDWKIAKLQHSN